MSEIGMYLLHDDEQYSGLLRHLLIAFGYEKVRPPDRTFVFLVQAISLLVNSKGEISTERNPHFNFARPLQSGILVKGNFVCEILFGNSNS
jgi:hypothetical protein